MRQPTTRAQRAEPCAEKWPLSRWPFNRGLVAGRFRRRAPLAINRMCSSVNGAHTSK